MLQDRILVTSKAHAKTRVVQCKNLFNEQVKYCSTKLGKHSILFYTKKCDLETQLNKYIFDLFLYLLQTLLSYVASNGSIDLLEFILQLPGLDPNKADNEGNTPLHFAAQAGEFIDFFIRGANWKLRFFLLVTVCLLINLRPK